MLHDNYGINEKGHLTVGGADTVALAEKYGTPLYILDEDRVRLKCRQYKAAMEKYLPKGSMPFYASKALSFVGMWALARKYLEQWFFWIVVDAVCCFLYIQKGIPFKAGLYGLYVVIAIAGYYKWKQMLKITKYDKV